jgi:hypothetical protein
MRVNEELRVRYTCEFRNNRERMQASKLPPSSSLNFLRPLPNHLAEVGQEIVFVLFKFIQLLL